MLHLLAWISIIVLALIVGGLLYQTLGTRRDRQRFPPPGRLVEVGNHRLHLFEQGSGSPTIVLEAGLMSSMLSWNPLQRELAKSYRVVSYDRAGLGWSDLGPMPRSSDRMVDELHTLLQRAGVPPPYVLVGHSFGGLTVPLFASRFPEETAGFVLLDPVAPGEWNPPSEQNGKLARTGAVVCRRAALLCRVGLIRFVAFLLSTRLKGAAAYLVRLISRGAPANAGSVSSPWFSALPANEKEMAAIFWTQEKFALTIASQLENLPASAARIGELHHVFDKPVVILSASTAPENRRNEHAAMASRLTLGEHVFAAQSNHWIMQHQPELVVRAIEKVVAQMTKRQDRSLAAAPSSGS